jgi:hypothetical protein
MVLSMAVKPIEFSEVFRRELHEIYERRQARGERTVGLPELIKPDGLTEEPHLFNALLKNVTRIDDAKAAASAAVQASAEGDRDAASEASAARIGSATEEPDPEQMKRGLVGLALSGGGIRSASFCLGALQALDRFGIFSKFDYMSTVSGGGYIGASLSSLYANAPKIFRISISPGYRRTAIYGICAATATTWRRAA